MNPNKVFANAQLLMFNPICSDSAEVQKQYYWYLRKIVYNRKWNGKKYVKAQMTFYARALGVEGESETQTLKIEYDLLRKYYFSLPFDLAAIIAFDAKLLQSSKFVEATRQIIGDLCLTSKEAQLIHASVQMTLGFRGAWEKIRQSSVYIDYSDYYNRVHDNMQFVQKKLYGMLITATMSAGKSSFINALVGQSVNRVQNMACTSKIHSIIAKPLDDGCTCEYDDEIVFDAGAEELLNDNENNSSSTIYVSTYFHGMLGGHRLVIHDSPGVNSSENIDHMTVAHQMICSKKYKLLIYVLNATQLGTNDDEEHLKYVASQVGKIPVMFVMNKIDSLVSEDEVIEDVVKHQREFLISKGFQNPIICPVSSRAAYLAKKDMSGVLSRMESRELTSYMDKFEFASLAPYYEQTFGVFHVADNEDEVLQLLKNCGMSYIENIICYLSEGGKINGTGIC